MGGVFISVGFHICTPLCSWDYTHVASVLIEGGIPNCPFYRESHSMLNHTIHVNVYAGNTNEFAQIEFDFTQTNSVKCIFLNGRDTSVKSCEITYWHGETCLNSSSSQHSHRGDPTVADIVVINLPQLYFQQDHSVYCYTLAARNQTYKISVSGKYTSGTEFDHILCRCNLKAAACMQSCIEASCMRVKTKSKLALTMHMLVIER